MPRKDRSFTHNDVIRIFEKNLDDSERIKVLVYMFLYLLGFDKCLVVLRKVYQQGKDLTFSEIGTAVFEVITFFGLSLRKWKSIDFHFEKLFQLYGSTQNKPAFQRKIKKKSQELSKLVA